MMRSTFASICVVAGLAMAIPAIASSPAPIDPAKAAALAQLLDAIGYEKDARAAVEQAKATLPAALSAAAHRGIDKNPKVTAQNRKEVLAKVDKEVAKLSQEILDRHFGSQFIAEHKQTLSTVFAAQFTVDEIQQLASIYRTPGGKKLIDKIYDATQELGKALQAQNQKRQLEISREFETRVLPLLPK